MTQQTEEKGQEALMEMEILDEQQIVESLRGRVIQQFFYEFKIGDKDIVGISWAGIKHIASKLVDKDGNFHPISVVELKVEENEETYKALAKAKDLHTQEERWGAAEQLKFLDPEQKKRNPFSYTLSVSKAQRNAIKQFVPEIAIQEAYKEWRDKQRQPKLAEEPKVETKVITPVTREELEQVLDEEFKAATLQLIEHQDRFEILIINPIKGEKHKELGQLLAHYGGRYTPEAQKLYWTIPKPTSPAPSTSHA